MPATMSLDELKEEIRFFKVHLDMLLPYLDNDEFERHRFWHNWMLEVRIYLKEGRLEAACRKLQDAFGGMGSFTDIPAPDDPKFGRLKDKVAKNAENILKNIQYYSLDGGSSLS